MNLRTLSLALVLAVLLLDLSPALANKDKDTLTFTGILEPPNITPYANNQRGGIIFGHHIWDTLLYRDETTGEMKPHLATKVTVVDPTTIDVELRHDVKWHNGDPFTADDVVYTVKFALDPASKIANVTRMAWLSGAEKKDDFHVVLKLKEPFPAAMAYLANYVMIYPAAYHQKAGEEGFAKAPVGTGPYKVTEVTPGKRIVLQKNTAYFGGAKGQPTIGTLIYRPIIEKNTQLAELMTGSVDWMWDLEASQAQKLTDRKGLTVSGGDTMRIMFITMDAAGRSGDTPMKDKRVRQAINHAIDRNKIKTLYPPGNSVINLACYPTQFGCESPDAPRYEYSPSAAKKLLAEAGHPDGFTIDFYGYTDRPVMEAMQGNLRAVGIDAKIQMLQYPPLRDKMRGNGIAMAFLTWGSGSVPDVTASTPVFFKNTPDDLARDPKVIALLEKGDTSMDPAVRKQAYAEALKIIAEEAYWVPLFSKSLYYAYTDKLDFKPSDDEIPRFFAAKWK